MLRKGPLLKAQNAHLGVPIWTKMAAYKTLATVFTAKEQSDLQGTARAHVVTHAATRRIRASAYPKLKQTAVMKTSKR